MTGTMPNWPDTVRVREGEIATPAPSDGVRAFLGIPYAAPPVGDRRWRAPQPANAWTGVRRADRYGLNCPQPRLVASIDPDDPGQSEDCLYLNVWTPAAAPDERLPVLVWIHGGAFFVGKAMPDGTDAWTYPGKGIVMVSLNYRLGVFGFLSHPQLSAETPEGASGNYGLMDQIAALRWVRDTIAAFGGDPERVTIMGHSSGGSSVNILMLSPLARNLFHGAIGLGGSAMRATGINDGSPLPRATEERKGERFVRSVGATSIAELRAISADRLVAASGTTIGEWAWNASVDGAVLPAEPAEILARGDQNDVPLMVGWGADEGSIMARDSFGGDEQPFASTIEKSFGTVSARMQSLYPSDTPERDRAAKTALAGDGFIIYPSWRWAVGQIRTGRSSVYVSQFAFAPTLAETWSTVIPLLGPAGAFHGAQMPYLLGTLAGQMRWIVGPLDYEVSHGLVDLVTNFIRTGDPNGPGECVWPAYRLDAPLKLRVEPDGMIHAVDDDDFARLSALGDIFADAPEGALRYRGMDARGN